MNVRHDKFIVDKIPILRENFVKAFSEKAFIFKEKLKRRIIS